MTPNPKEWIFHRGEPSPKTGRYGKFAIADEAGGAAFEIPTTGVKSLQINITTPGFGPFWAQWNPAESTAVIPESYTVHLDAGVSVGGITVDDQGKPIAGVSINPSLEFKKREEDLSQLGVGARVKSDENGRWVFHSVPAAFESLSIGLDHPEYMGGSYVQLPLKDYTVARGAEPSRPILVPRGEVVTGKVTSSDGKPISGAKIRAKFVNSQREAATDESGVYRLKGCQPGPGAVFATAKEFGPQVAQLNIGPDIAPVDFQLPPGRTIRVRAVDSQGRPIPKFRVFFRRWKVEDYGYGLGLQLTYANENGVWEWNEAPEDAVIADICPPNMTQLSDQSLVARDEDYVFTFSDDKLPATIFGAVVDRVTSQPIKEFRVVPGEDLGDRVLWFRRAAFDGKDGKFYYRSESPRGGYRFRIEADGYRTADSELVASRGGNSNVQVQLFPGERVSSTVLLPSGEPAAGATVVVGVARTQIQFQDGEFRGDSSLADRRTSDQSGKFSFPSQVGPYEVIAVHPLGSAWVQGTPGEPLKPVTLTPWAQVKGVLKVGRQPGRSVKLELNHQGSVYDQDRPSVSLNYSTTTADDGTFEWKRVFPGEGMIAKNVAHHVTSRSSMHSYSHSQRATFRAGEVTELALGGNGRPVSGKLQAPAGLKGTVDWNFAIVELTGQPRAQSYCTAVRPDGSFRIEDIPPGEYRLRIELNAPNQDRIGEGATIGQLLQQITVSNAADPSVDRAQDLGVLILKEPGKE
jgi:hypothetical protein